MTDNTSAEQLPRRHQNTLWLIFLFFIYLSLWFLILVYVPMQWKKFDEFAVQLPWLTRLVLDFSRYASDFWWLFQPASFLATIGIVLAGRFAFPKSRFSNMYAIACIAVLLGMIGVIIVSLALPMIKIAEGLVK